MEVSTYREQERQIWTRHRRCSLYPIYNLSVEVKSFNPCCHQLLEAAEACSSDPASVPQELLACAVPSLVTLACAAPAPHSAAAAAALAAALLGSASLAWRPHLGNVEIFTGRCVAAALAPQLVPGNTKERIVRVAPP